MSKSSNRIRLAAETHHRRTAGDNLIGAVSSRDYFRFRSVGRRGESWYQVADDCRQLVLQFLSSKPIAGYPDERENRPQTNDDRGVQLPPSMSRVDVHT